MYCLYFFALNDNSLIAVFIYFLKVITGLFSTFDNKYETDSGGVILLGQFPLVFFLSFHL